MKSECCLKSKHYIERDPIQTVSRSTIQNNLVGVINKEVQMMPHLLHRVVEKAHNGATAVLIHGANNG